MPTKAFYGMQLGICL